MAADAPTFLQRALVTGGTRGIGHAIVERLLAEGCHVTTCARDGDSLRECCASFAARYPEKIDGVVADIGVAADMEHLFTHIENQGGLDILVNNAAGVESGRLATLTDAQWQREIDTKLMAMVRSMRRAIPMMRQRGGGVIININSIFAKQPHLDFYASSVVRAGCLALTKLAAREHAAEQIRVNAIGLATVATEVWSEWYDGAVEGYEDFLTRSAAAYGVASGRMTMPDEVASIVAFLIGSEAAHITGTQIDVDGGAATYL